MSKQNVLPTILALLANSGAVLSPPISAAAAAAPANNATPSAMPIVALLTATNELREPDRLVAWTHSLVHGSSPSLDDGPPLGRCGTISGSGNGWDDSRQDC